MSAEGLPSRADGLPTCTVVVPSYRRPVDLDRCLGGVTRLDPPADEVLVVARAEDDETREVAARHGVAVVDTGPGGVVEAMLRGATAARGEVVAFTDDDAVPTEGWVGAILAPYRDPAVGGVGGRDHLVHHPPSPSREVVGRTTRYGRVVGSHHVGTGPARDVEVLKGVNMSFRRDLYVVPTNLRGNGAQYAHELGSSLAVVGAGRRLVYDPSILVEHHASPRPPDVARDRGALDDLYNHVLVLTSLGPRPRAAAGLWALAVGTPSLPGLVRRLLRRVDGSPPSLGDMVRAVREARRDRLVLAGPGEAAVLGGAPARG